ncbi:tetratricopeptide repeat protein [Amphibiibacter pelophylacis]|uniref:Tetratricopeptide repeat protein n=1 Tax=Amphibiibacter pelophylacis TaxID=1799477 RepID=A0ACC6P1V4_9BURK
MPICPGSGPAAAPLRHRVWPLAAAALLALTTHLAVAAPKAPASPSRAQLANEVYDGLVAEMENSLGQPGQGFDSMLQAAQRSADPDLFRRALELALQSGSRERSRQALRAWRTVMPASIEAMQRDVQFSLLTGQLSAVDAPLRDWLAATQDGDRVELIQALPRLLAVVRDRAQAQQELERVLKPYRAPLPKAPSLARDMATQIRVASELAVIQLASDPPSSGLPAVQAIHRAWPASRLPAIAALGMMFATPDAEPLVREVLATPGQDDLVPSASALRQAYASVLARQKRYPAALEQLQQAAQAQPPGQAGSRPVWLALAATALTARQWAQGESAVRRYLDDSVGWKDALSPEDAARGRLLLAEIQQGQGQLPQALKTLDSINIPALYVQGGLRRASILLQQGQWPQARALIASLKDDAAPPTDSGVDITVLRELQVLTDQKRWTLALQVLDAALAKDRSAELLYQKAMVLDRLKRTAEMDVLLQEALKLDPRHTGSQNALGYGWADRGVRLDEARRLITAALQAQPDDPYIMDSMGWVDFRQGRVDDALKNLRAAWLLSRDAEIAAHLGEVLWRSGQRDEARTVWAEALALTPDSEMIREVLKRLGASL